MSWRDLTSWWLGEIKDDPAYADVVTPMLLDLLDPDPNGFYLDLGCGEGRVMREIARRGSRVHGIDINEDLARKAGSAVVGALPSLPLRGGTYGGVYAVLVVEHLGDLDTVLKEAARVTKPGGVLVVVMNHPVWTAPGSTPVEDPSGEVLWRPGEYFSSGTSQLEVGGGHIDFYHRSMGELLNATAAAGWSLRRMIEQPHAELRDQAGIPRLLGCRWRLLP